MHRLESKAYAYIIKLTEHELGLLTKRTTNYFLQAKTFAYSLIAAERAVGIYINNTY